MQYRHIQCVGGAGETHCLIVRLAKRSVEPQTPVLTSIGGEEYGSVGITSVWWRERGDDHFVGVIGIDGDVRLAIVVRLVAMVIGNDVDDSHDTHGIPPSCLPPASSFFTSDSWDSGWKSAGSS